MSVMILSTENYTYLKEKITKLLMSHEHIRYNLKGLKELQIFDDQTVLNYIDLKVDELQKLNYESFYRKEISYREIQTGKIPKIAEAKLYQYTKFEISELLKLNDIINCILYQIEIEFNDDFIKTIQLYLLREIAERTKEIIGQETQ